MMQLARVSVLAAFFPCLLTPGIASAAGATASTLSASFTTDGVNTAIDPVSKVRSGPGNTYNKSVGMGAYHEQLILTNKGGNPPTLTVDAASGQSHVQGAFGVDTISAEGDAALSSVSMKLAPYTPPNSGVVLPPYLQIKVNALKETANYFYQAPGLTAVSGTGAINKLTITGPLVGNKTLTFTGKPTENKVLYQGNGITITLNQKIATALISCTPKCVLTPYSVSASGIDITLNGAKLGDRTVSGDISIGSGAAGIGRGE